MMKLNGLGARTLLASAAATVLLAGCGGSQNDEFPLIKVAVTVKTFSLGGVCETVPVRMVPVELRGQANKYANNRTMVLEIAMEGPTDENGAPTCNGSGESLPLAPGDWEFSAPLASGSAKCSRDIAAGGDLDIKLLDGIEGCSGPQAAPAYEEAPMDGEMPIDGEAPVDGEIPVEGESAPAEG